MNAAFHTYEIELGPATGRWQVYRIGPTADTFVGSYKTEAEARAAVSELRARGGA